ncbi:MAG: hypothetical protein JOS17DRAFT_756274 [Linnemannia elongata]|nr:MAG: hypothetical protein JOS17DRAFT_756274 [Linnemannia elongata]
MSQPYPPIQTTPISSSYPTGYPTGYPTEAPTSTYPPGTTYTSSPSPGSSNGSGSGSKSIVGPVVGGVVAGLVLIALLVAFFVMRQRKKRRDANKRRSDALEGRNTTGPITTVAATTGVGGGGNGSGGEGVAGSQQVPYSDPDRQYYHHQQQSGDQYIQEQGPYYAQYQKQPQDYYVESQSYRQNPQFYPIHGFITESTSPTMTQISAAGSNLAYCPPPFVTGPGSFEKGPPGAPHTIIEDLNTTNLPTTRNPQVFTEDHTRIPLQV